MTGLSLREAARQTGRSKSAMLRAVKSGKVSATRSEAGEWSIDASELFRVYEARTAPEAAAEPVRGDALAQDAVPADAAELARSAALEVEVRLLRERLQEMRDRVEELKLDRDRWHSEAARLVLPAPPRRGWWPFRRTA